MPKPTDIRPVAVELYFLPIKTRVPLKFGPEVTTEVTCARVKMTVEDRAGKRAERLGRDAALGPVGLAQPAQLRRAARGTAVLSAWRSRRPGCRHRSSPATRWRSAIVSSNTSCLV